MNTGILITANNRQQPETMKQPSSRH